VDVAADGADRRGDEREERAAAVRPQRQHERADHRQVVERERGPGQRPVIEVRLEVLAVKAEEEQGHHGGAERLGRERGQHSEGEFRHDGM
jgi:hypothetical protein